MDGARLLWAVIASNRCGDGPLRLLNLSNNRLVASHSLATAVSRNGTLECLALDGNQLGPGPTICTAFAQAIALGSPLVELDLGGNQIERAGAALLARALAPDAPCRLLGAAPEWGSASSRLDEWRDGHSGEVPRRIEREMKVGTTAATAAEAAARH